MKLNQLMEMFGQTGKKMRLGHSILIDGVRGCESILEDGERLIRFEEAVNVEKKGSWPYLITWDVRLKNTT